MPAYCVYIGFDNPITITNKVSEPARSEHSGGLPPPGRANDQAIAPFSAAVASGTIGGVQDAAEGLVGLLTSRCGRDRLVRALRLPQVRAQALYLATEWDQDARRCRISSTGMWILSYR